MAVFRSFTEVQESAAAAAGSGMLNPVIPAACTALVPVQETLPAPVTLETLTVEMVQNGLENHGDEIIEILKNLPTREMLVQQLDKTLDQKLDQKFAEFEQKLDQKWDQKLDQKLTAVKTEIYQTISRDVVTHMVTKQEFQVLDQRVAGMDQKLDLVLQQQQQQQQQLQQQQQQLGMILEQRQPSQPQQPSQPAQQ